MKKWNLIVDVAECHNCNNCFIGCKDEYVGNDFPGYAAAQPLHGGKWINILSKERGVAPMVDIAHLPTMCNHCDNAPCVRDGRGAVIKRDDGIVIIDPRFAVGRRDLLSLCPYGAIWWNDALDLPQAWPFDAHLLDAGWHQPRCVQSCATGALRAVKLSDEEMQALVSSEGLEPLAPEYGTKPRVYYKNLYRYSKLFIGGSVVVEQSGVLDCAAEMQVALLKNGEVCATTKTDAFGEFKFDALDPNSGAFVVRILPEVSEARSVDVVLAHESVVLHEIRA